jgi:TonB family protein
MIPAMNTAAIGSDWVGRVIDGRFPLLQWLGGSRSTGVFLTQLPGSPPQRAAIKLLPANPASPDARLAIWAKAAALSHPNLMHLFDSGNCQIGESSLLYVVTEYAEENLAQVLPDRSLTPQEVEQMLEPVLHALAYLHAHGLVHGHLKPSNILVVGDELKLSSDSLESIGRPAAHLRPPDFYDAPERASQLVSPAADIWSLGVTLVAALTQQPPALDPSTTQDPPVPESIPQPFAAMARECLHRDPLRRCTLGDLNARLNPPPLPLVPPIKTPAPAPVSAATAPVTPVEPATSSRRIMLIVSAALVLLAVCAGLLFHPHKRQSSPPAASNQPAPEAAAPSPQPSPPATPSAQGPPVKGAVAHQFLPDVPQSASNTIWGTVVVKVRVHVDAGGSVTSAGLDSPGPSKYFAKLSLEAAQKWQFKPAQVNGQPAPSVWLLEFQFTNDSTKAISTEVLP